MSAQPFDQKSRGEILKSHRHELARYQAVADVLSSAPVRSAEEQAALRDMALVAPGLEQSAAAYFEGVPRIPMGTCPFDDKPLYRTFDPFGFDGLWWRSDATPREIPSCPHFCFLHGAVNFNGHKPVGGEFEAHTGPEVPYVIPRILALPGVIAVLSQLDMVPGHIAYAIAYFAERRPTVEKLAANWPRTIYLYTTPLNEHRWRMDNDARDFDLAPWLRKGKIRWCPPEDNGKLAPAAAPCPFLDLPGERRSMVVRGNSAWAMGKSEK